jgi:hypothetical protein
VTHKIRKSFSCFVTNRDMTETAAMTKNNWELEHHQDDDKSSVGSVQNPLESSLGDMEPSSEQDGVNAEVNMLVSRENCAVNLLRAAVLVVLIAAFVAVLLVFQSFRGKEYQAFEEEYQAISTRIIDMYRNDILQKLWVASNLASTLTAIIQAQELQAPNITIPSFHAISASAVKLAPVDTVKWAPLLFNPQHVISGLAGVSGFWKTPQCPIL